MTAAIFVHESAFVDPGAQIGDGTKIWHFVHIRESARIGLDCVIGQNCYIGNVSIGDGCRIQNNVSVFDGVELKEEVFVGPSAVFTNIDNPRAAVSRREQFVATVVEKGVTIGANATIRCGVRIGAYAFIGAGAVVTQDVEAHAVMVGNPARKTSRICCCGASRGQDVVCQLCDYASHNS